MTIPTTTQKSLNEYMNPRQERVVFTDLDSYLIPRLKQLLDNVNDEIYDKTGVIDYVSHQQLIENLVDISLAIVDGNKEAFINGIITYEVDKKYEHIFNDMMIEESIREIEGHYDKKPEESEVA